MFHWIERYIEQIAESIYDSKVATLRSNVNGDIRETADVLLRNYQRSDSFHVRTAVENYIASEEFISAIVDRINKLQVAK